MWHVVADERMNVGYSEIGADLRGYSTGKLQPNLRGNAAIVQ